MYLTYETYKSMGGTLAETSFNKLEFEAECIVNWYTMDRLKEDTEYPPALEKCMYALIDILYIKSLAMNLGQDPSGNVTTTGAIASQSNDGVSISYNVMSASEAIKQYSSDIENTIKLYLNSVTNSLGRRLLYRGYYPGE